MSQQVMTQLAGTGAARPQSVPPVVVREAPRRLWRAPDLVLSAAILGAGRGNSIPGSRRFGLSVTLDDAKLDQLIASGVPFLCLTYPQYAEEIVQAHPGVRVLAENDGITVIASAVYRSGERGVSPTLLKLTSPQR